MAGVALGLLLDTLSQDAIIAGSEHCEYGTYSCVCGIGAADIEVQILSLHINNFQLTGEALKLVKLYNLCSCFN